MRSRPRLCGDGADRGRRVHAALAGALVRPRRAPRLRRSSPRAGTRRSAAAATMAGAGRCRVAVCQAAIASGSRDLHGARGAEQELASAPRGAFSCERALELRPRDEASPTDSSASPVSAAGCRASAARHRFFDQQVRRTCRSARLRGARAAPATATPASSASSEACEHAGSSTASRRNGTAEWRRLGQQRRRCADHAESASAVLASAGDAIVDRDFQVVRRRVAAWPAARSPRRRSDVPGSQIEIGRQARRVVRLRLQRGDRLIRVRR